MSDRAEMDRLDDAVNDALGRVLARIEIYDDAVAQNGAYQVLALQELLARCRDLKRAYDAKTAHVLRLCSADPERTP